MSLSFDSFVLAASTATLDAEPAARDHADAVEFRMDLAADPFVELDDYDGRLPVLATNRASWEGGESEADEEARLASLERAARYDAVAAVDVELDALETRRGVSAAERAREADAAVVASVHDFERTPATSELRGLLHEAASVGDVGKVAVTTTSRSDALRLLEATHAATAWGDAVATMGMGEAGRHTRAVAPVYGSKIGYAPVHEDEATAPGQYDLATLARLVERLGSR
ncbi:type I 3-dehydroquinate dehydratase [Halogeometricum sp. CBA1124]|uniref:type I 3-dehydroquinate dehydratase n=1 Tax=Halogeometricum sp. CBA1124 TaxID=2668071 RepID=UPI00142925F8|nr:type I 3-dehydroquinate dehydratase [Halogeometricum sp. CBA1124]MUV58106.1 type I 3-dehydroquinate dehydratase [Halogeometricum sp. CBA1124]